MAEPKTVPSTASPVPAAKGADGKPAVVAGVSPIAPIEEGQPVADDQKDAERGPEYMVRTPLDDMADFEQSLRDKSEDEKKKAREDRARKQQEEARNGAKEGQTLQRSRMTFMGGVTAPEGIAVGSDVYALESGPGMTVGIIPVGADHSKVGAQYVPLTSLVRAKEQG